jgi:hypothetical protein
MKRWRLAWLLAPILALLALGRLPAPRPGVGAQASTAPPRTFPALDGVTLPPNIAPPGLRIDEPGTAFDAVLRGARGAAIEVASRRPGVVFPQRRWRRLLAANAGGSLTLTVSVRDRGGCWTRLAPVSMDVAAEPIDGYLVYRNLTPLYNLVQDVGVYQRDLTGFGTRTILHSWQLDSGCMNCHTFWQGSGRRFSLATRGSTTTGTLLVSDGRVARLKQPVGYGCWHPNGRLAAFSVNGVHQFFHAAGEETRDVLDLTSAIVCFDLTKRCFTTAPALSSRAFLNTYPTWSPDGRWLYFCQAKRPWPDKEAFPPSEYDQVRYSLRRLPFDPDTGAFGEPETLRSGDEAGRSFVFPRISPDGRWLLYTSCDYGCFPIHRPNSDLGLIDLWSGQDVPVEINSDRADTWHSWSRNGRWVAFASKRADGLFTKLYLSYFDTEGHFHRPLLLPQRSPWFYDRCWYSFNVPELLAEPVTVNAAELGRAARGAPTIDAPLPPEAAPPGAQER